MRYRILIADDNPSARKTLHEFLGNNGQEVCAEAENGQEAVTKALELKPDVVVLDLAMPELDGLAAARRISEAMPGTPIILHTFHDLPQLELEAEKNGVSCVVPKTDTGRILPFLEQLKEPAGSRAAAEMPIETPVAAAEAAALPAAKATSETMPSIADKDVPKAS